MNIQVLFFAVFRERFGRPSAELELEKGATADDAIAALKADYPNFAAVQTQFQVAVNEAMVPRATVLQEGDVLALIPPVSGGTDKGRHILLSEEPLSLERAIAAVSSPSAGAIATFTGTVRNHSKGRDVSRLEYEAYPSMVERVFADLCAEIEVEFPGTNVAVEHRVGTLAIGDEAVVIAASAPHRKEAFAACQAMIDRLKDRSPIWKKEVGPDGSEWVGIGP